jgi:SAM-dependent MidA family methyltransferase
MSVAEYMALCLAHYYGTRDPFGAHGDFITAPEVSQMFGELIGLWAAAVWQQMGSPARVHLIELGPGRGTLMADALRAAKAMPKFREAISVHLIEISPVLKARQRKTLRDTGVPIEWYPDLQEVPAGPAIIIANEFFDALPVHQAVKHAGAWYERCVGIGANDKLEFTLAAEPLSDDMVPAALRGAAEGSVFEWRDAAAGQALGRRVAQGGAALVIDYGHTQSGLGETLQAVGAHAYADPLATPGEIDLTAHVDFERLIADATSAGSAAFGPIEQGEFLRRLGIEVRTAKLKANASPEQAAAVDAALARLTGRGSKQMGALFKVAAFASPGLALPAF